MPSPTLAPRSPVLGLSCPQASSWGGHSGYAYCMAPSVGCPVPLHPSASVAPRERLREKKMLGDISYIRSPSGVKAKLRPVTPC